MFCGQVNHFMVSERVIIQGYGSISGYETILPAYAGNHVQKLRLKF